MCARRVASEIRRFCDRIASSSIASNQAGEPLHEQFGVLEDEFYLNEVDFRASMGHFKMFVRRIPKYIRYRAVNIRHLLQCL